MGDAENTLPSKKRAAGRELSRGNPGLDDEEEFPGQETGTFKRVSDEVLANRKIVKVKRGQTSSTLPAPSCNPFAAVCCLVPPASFTPAFVHVNSLQEIEKPDSEKLVVGNDKSTHAGEEKNDGNDKLEGNDKNTPASEKENDENEDTLDENDENTPVSEKEILENKDNVAGNDESTLAEEKEINENKIKVEDNDESTLGPKIHNVGKKENLGGNSESTPAFGTINSFQQLSSSQNAFTGLLGTGFPSSSFSFGSFSKFDLPVFPSFSFGTNGNASLFGNIDKKTEGTKTTPSFKKDLKVETGEENEKTVFTADSILFEFIDGGWKEQGKGELKVNVLTFGTRKARLVMRARGNYRLILNASIFPDMKLSNMEKKGITFACLNSTGEGQNGLSTFALKFKDASIVDVFRSVVMAHKGNLMPPIDLKTKSP